jgi:hypothetical protein
LLYGIIWRYRGGVRIFKSTMERQYSWQKEQEWAISISWREHVTYQWNDDEVRFVLDQRAELDCDSASSLKQLSHLDTLFWFLFNHSLFLLLSDACLAEKQQYQFKFFGLTRPGLELTIFRTSTLTITPPMRLKTNMTKGQTMVHKILHRKIKMEQHEPN